MKIIPKNIEAVFFDLDGTLLDTAPDLAAACNQILQEHQKPPVSLNEFKYYIHGGAAMMIGESFGIHSDHPDYPKLKSQFLKIYQSQTTQNTCVYPGIEKTLEFLEKNRIPWGVVTNKFAYLTKPIMDYFGFSPRCCCLICGDTLPTSKPHPAPLLHACELTGVQPKNCVFVGDSLSDMQAAAAAGMFSVAAAYGYLPKNHQLASWPSGVTVYHPDELTHLFKTCWEAYEK